MSSGPSARSENPRSGSSICGDEMPRSSSTPSTRAMPQASSAERELRKPGAAKSEARVGPRAGGGLGGGIAIEWQRGARRGPSAERMRRAVPAAAEGGVDVRAVGLDSQRGHGFLEQDRNVVAIAASEREAVELGRQIAGRKRHRGAPFARATCVSSQSSNLLPCPTRTTRLSSAAYCRSAGGTRMRPARVEHDVVGVANEQSLQAAELVVEARERHQPLLDRLPLGKRIEQQAVPGIGGQHQAAGIARGQRFAVLGRESPAGPCCPVPDA